MAHGNAIAGRTVARPDSKRPRVSDERGITGLETAIVLIAFVVVASVFAFAVLSTGLLSSQTAKEAVTGGLGETATILGVKGTVVARSTGSPLALERVLIPVSSSPGTSKTVDLTTSTIAVTYTDGDDLANVAWNANADTAGANMGWVINWLGTASPDALDATEQAVIVVNINDGGTLITTRPGAGDAFTIQIKPSQGKVLEVKRSLPILTTEVVSLD